ncbi:hypothetical protein Nepgr_021585 [Nepenthes gracilis]|uniref:Uncharacterized protein n=1 Tax=Nepenthes gracilis TaxID=150966 RepID=A0AAD3SZL5_NEPGR|nr:hypothetical protein Nepgr_021585 [Nepenthes gracilis]
MAAPPHVEEKLEKVLQQVFGGDNGGGVDLCQSPFTAEIWAKPLLLKFKMSNLDIYDGSADPIDHLDHFREHLSLQNLNEMTMCQYFPLTLKGDARVWQIKKQPWHLARVKKGARESLRGFLAKFIAEARQIPKLTDGVKLNAFLSELEGVAFFKHLIYNGRQTFAEAEAGTRAYIAVEEANDTKRPIQVESFPSRPVEGKRKHED